MADGPISGVLRSLQRLLGRSRTADVPDRQLLEQFVVAQSQTAFAALVERHGPLVLGVCRRVLTNEQDAEDAFQATFLLLAQKAASVRWRDAIDHWLYEVAHRTACHARGRKIRRSRHETQAAAMPLTEETDWDAHERLRLLLDAELLRLPRKYRLPLLLCYLQDQTREQAAQRLGWTPGAVKGRLERGREMLRQRLVRRGVVLTALPLLLVEQPTVSAALVENTVQAATSGTMALPVAALLKGVTKAMFWTRIKWTLILLVGLSTAAVGLARLGGAGVAADPPAPKDAPAKDVELTIKAGAATTALLKDGSNADPVKLTFAFRNVSERELKLDTTGLSWAFPLLTLEVVGPDGKPVPAKERATREGGHGPAVLKTWETIAPGKTWEIERTIPGVWTQGLKTTTEYAFTSPGTYRIKAVYKVESGAEGTWHGPVTSNEIEIKVKAAK